MTWASHTCALIASLIAACARHTPAASPPAPAVTKPPALAGDDDLTLPNNCTHKNEPATKPCTLTRSFEDDIRRAAEEKTDAIRVCYEAAVKRVGPRSGSLRVAWRIDDNGAVDCVGVVRDPMRDEAFRKCVEGAFADVRHPMGCAADATWSYGLRPPR